MAAARGSVDFEALNRIMLENEELGSFLHLTDSIGGLQQTKAEPYGNTDYVSVVNNVAMISLFGPIFPRANSMTRMSGATSIQKYVAEFSNVYNDSDIKGIVQRLDSPGGDVRGIGEGSKIISSLVKSNKKPVKSYVEGYMASAAYYVGSTSQEILSDRSGLSGSIGVVLSGTKKEDNSFEITSSVSPYKRVDPTEAEGRAILQEQVDDLADIFVSDVAKYRNVPKQTILDNYGKGSVKVGPRALKQGMVDGLSSLSQVVGEMVRDVNKSSVAVGRAAGWSDDKINALMNSFAEEIDDAPMAQEDNADNSLLALEEKANMGFLDTIKRLGQSKETIDEKETAQNPAGSKSEDSNASAVITGQPNIVQASRNDLMEQFADAGELFATRQVTANKILPFQAAGVAVEFINAKIDDKLFAGNVTFINAAGQVIEGTREQSVIEKYNSMAGHSLTEKSIEAIKNGSISASVLKEGDEEKVVVEQVTDERVTQLLASSTAGRAVLGNNKAQGK